jgi:hypothetical protein
MAFERLEVQAKAGGRLGKPASVTLSCVGGAKRPAACISLSEELRIAAGFFDTTKFDVLIGRGEDSGRLRLVASKYGIVKARVFKTTKAYFVNLGFVPEIGTVRAKRTPTDARVIEGGTVEIDIPDFDRGGDEDVVVKAPAVKTPAIQAASAIAAIMADPASTPADKKSANGKSGNGHAPAPAADPMVETYNGVSIDFAEDDERVTFKSKTTEITAEQALLIRALARPRPTPVAEAFLISQVWKKSPPKYATEQLRAMTQELQKGLKPLGLELKKVPGVGYQLRGD